MSFLKNASHILLFQDPTISPNVPPMGHSVRMGIFIKPTETTLTVKISRKNIKKFDILYNFFYFYTPYLSPKRVSFWSRGRYP
jgi:hypothetical protein